MDGPCLSVTDQLGRLTEIVYDASGNLIEHVDAMGKFTLQTFDAEGRVLTRTDWNSQTTTFEYSPESGPASPFKVFHPDGEDEAFYLQLVIGLKMHWKSNTSVSVAI